MMRLHAAVVVSVHAERRRQDRGPDLPDRLGSDMRRSGYVCSITQVVAFAALVAWQSHAQVIPAARRFPEAWQNAGYQGRIPAPDRIVNVTDHGAVADGTTDDRAAIVAAISALGGSPGVVYFPSGTYKVNASFSVPAGVVLRGQRPASTTLKFETLGHCINIAGTTAGSFQAVTSGYAVHSSSIVVTDGSVFQVGDFAEMHQDNDPAWSPSSTQPLSRQANAHDAPRRSPVSAWAESASSAYAATLVYLPSVLWTIPRQCRAQPSSRRFPVALQMRRDASNRPWAARYSPRST